MKVSKVLQMKALLTLLILLPSITFSRTVDMEVLTQDSLILVDSNPSKGFWNSYLLFLPKGTPLNKRTFLLVEPNNTGKTSDSMIVHKKAAIDLASSSSVGNNICTNLKIPFLVPIFPRPETKALVYTHALDRDVILEENEDLRRLDLQLIAMIEDARIVLTQMKILTYEQIFLNGFSASATFTNRFLFIHPKKVKAAAMGGLNGELMLPLKNWKSQDFDYPLGLHDFEEIFGNACDLVSLRKIPQYIYMGKEDQNDAVQYYDAYNAIERKLINTSLGSQVQERWVNGQAIYLQENLNVEFHTFEGVGHWTTPFINIEVSKFFLRQMNDQSSN